MSFMFSNQFEKDYKPCGLDVVLLPELEQAVYADCGAENAA